MKARLALLLLLALPSGCECPKRWFLTLHCPGGQALEVECGSRENCLALAKMAFTLSGPCQDGSVGSRSTCEGGDGWLPRF